MARAGECLRHHLPPTMPHKPQLGDTKNRSLDSHSYLPSSLTSADVCFSLHIFATSDLQWHTRGQDHGG